MKIANIGDNVCFEDNAKTYEDTSTDDDVTTDHDTSNVIGSDLVDIVLCENFVQELKYGFSHGRFDGHMIDGYRTDGYRILSDYFGDSEEILPIISHVFKVKYGFKVVENFWKFCVI